MKFEEKSGHDEELLIKKLRYFDNIQRPTILSMAHLPQQHFDSLMMIDKS